jgi:DNA helicase-2/ATP-dependent DNA helicase PcrA
MILWVIEKFKELPELLMEYQERYQYILVDEYQDTNGSQNQLLDLLASYWEDPNLFAVGDDDQSIYRFQGANMDNIELFKDKYQAKVIVLENNYRSSQEILDSATSLIMNNSKRLVNTYGGDFVKNLVESRVQEAPVKIKPSIKVYPNITQEEISIAKQIIDFHKSGVQLSEVAVIYRNHKNVSNIVKYLEMKDIPLNIKRRLNVLDTPEILRIINILEYLENEGRYIDSANSQLFEMLHYEYFRLKPRDIGKVAVHCSRRTDEGEDDITWDATLTSRETLEKLGVSNIDPLMKVYELIQSWISDSKNLTLQVLFGKILTEGNIINTIMNSSDKVWRLQLVNTFFDFIKDESVKKPDMNLFDLLRFIEIMNANDIRMPFEKIVSNKEGINFITAHSSKGLEFKYVFMIRCESKNWEAKRLPSKIFKFPSKFVPTSDKGDEEDERRLFFVSMTRAKDYLYLSYPAADDNEKAMEPSRFLAEIEFPENYTNSGAEIDQILEYKADLMSYIETDVELIDHDLIDRILENYSMSVTSLTKYLECPLRFYFENILRVPQARNANTGFGKAMHYAMEQIFIQINDHPERYVPPIEKLLEYFLKGMERTRSHYTSQEFENLKVYGQECLRGYYDVNHMFWNNANHYKLEYKIDLTQFDGIPIKGVIDKLSIFEKHVEVVDYKTGKYVYAVKNMKPPLGEDDIGGRYWRQIVFYQMLLNADPKMEKPMRKGTMAFLEKDDKDNFRNVDFEVSDFEIDKVGTQLKDTYQKIQNHEFSVGCQEEDCKWCNFVNNNFSLEETLEELEEDER